MKYLLLSILLCAAFSCKTTKQIKEIPKNVELEVYELKMVYQPNSEYVTELTQVTTTAVALPNMPEQSVVYDVSSTSRLSFGPMIDNQCEMLIVYDKMDVQVTGAGAEQAEKPELAGMKIYGKLSDGVQSVDSIVGADQSIQDMMEVLLEPMFSNVQINFPSQMKLGDDFLDTKVMEIPIKGMGSSTITSETKYTLTNVTNAIADLTTHTKITGEMTIMEQKIPLEGAGSGMMSIDMENHYSPSSSAVIDQELTFDMQGMTMEQKINVSLSMQTQKIK